MRIKFWGARGSIPSPLRPEYVEEKICQAILGLPDIDPQDVEAVRAYVGSLPPLVRGTAGGNTPCVEIRAGSEILIVDAGSGLRELGMELMQGPCGRGQGVLHVFISHPHWDHIQGFPFFPPAYVPGNRIRIYGPHDLEKAFELQQNPLNCPVSLSYVQDDLSFMRADIGFVVLKVGQPLSIGPVHINLIRNPHPGDAYSYRFEDQHGVFVYASDIEHKHLDEASLKPHIDFAKGANVLVFDAQYTLREAWHQKEDWGHSSAWVGVDLARAAGVDKLILFHHDPAYSDSDLLKIMATAQTYQAQDTTRPACKILVAYEGLTLDLVPQGSVSLQLAADGETAVLTPASVFDEGGVDQLVRQLDALAKQGSSSIIDLSQVEMLTTASLKALVALQRGREGVPTVLAAPSARVRHVIELAGYQDYFSIYPSVDVARAAVQAREVLGLPGQVFKGRYQIETKIGSGGLVDVLKATDIQTARTVAIKVLAPWLSQRTIDRFMRQAQQVVNLEHPNIVKSLAWDKEGAHYFVVEEFVEGPTLQQYLEGGVHLSADDIMGVALDASRALEYAHSQGVVHGNLKPRNIYLVPEGVKVNGFGLGRLEEGRNLLEAPMLFLEAAYLAPEQILGEVLDARTDLYTLGVILYQLVTGHLPFEGADREMLLAHLNRTPRPPRDLNPRVSPPLEHLVLKLLEKNPNDRYTSAQQTRRISGGLVINTEDSRGKRRLPLIGREEPLFTLRTGWQEACAGRGRLVFISGEAGVGKTSLAQQAAEQNQPAVLLIGHCRQFTEASSLYYLFIQVLQAYFSTVPPELVDEQARQLLSDVAYFVPEVRQMLPDLPAPSGLEPEHEQLHMMSCLTQFIQRATQQRPWFLILDDLQWADPGSIEVLRYLAWHVPSMALMVVGIYRDLELERGHPLLALLNDLSSHPACHLVALERLDQLGVELMLVNLWQQPVPTALVQRIYRHTGGNPTYVEEVAKGLIDASQITVQDGQWRFPALEDLSLPRNVREVVARRIEYLSPDTRALLHQAAVLGPTFKLDDLREMSGWSERQILDCLDMALERELVEEMQGNGMLRFRHAEIHHVLYTDIGPLRRRILHRQAAEALERRAMPEPERIARELAYHFGEAGEFEMTAVYSIQAARQMQAAFANEVALGWYQRTLEVLDQLDPEQIPAFQPLRLSAQRGMGEVLTLLGRHGEALEHFATARILLETEMLPENHIKQLADLHRQIAFVYERRGEYDLALSWLDRGARYLEPGEPTPELAHIYTLYGTVYLHRGDHEAARTKLERALSLAKATGLRQVEADSLRTLGVAFWRLGRYAQAGVCYKQSLAINREMGSRQGESNVLNNLGIIALDQGDFSAATSYYKQALVIKQDIGDRQGERSLFHNLGLVSLRQGDYATARGHYEQALAISHEMADKYGQSTTLNDLGLAYHAVGDGQAALRYSQQALQIAQEIGALDAQGYALTNLGHALESLGQLAEAAEAYQQSVDILQNMGQAHLAIEPQAGLARVLMAQERLAQAQACVEEIVTFMEERPGTRALEGTDDPGEVYLTCYRVLQTVQDPRAPAILKTAYTLLQEQAAKIDDEELHRSFLQNVRSHREIVYAWQSDVSQD
ncbi:MAG: tetratricopeptide repeat protein [Thermoflexales bacterium]|nr:tetratricopeptide repeat protein [Thermoflexales bacterium]